MDLHVGRYPGSSMELEVEPKVRAAPDLLTELSTARLHGRALMGAEPAEVIGFVPTEWVRERGSHWLTAWQSLVGDSENAAHMVLTACRIWRFSVEGVYSSKAQAATWVLARDASLTAVGQALRQRMEDPETPISEAGIAQVLATALHEIKSRHEGTPAARD